MWPNRENTDDMLEQARQGEAGAVDRLFGEFREPLRRVVGLRLDPVLARRIDASDIVQDVLIEANLRLKEYLKAPNMPFHLWLRHLAQDRIIDTHRRHRLAQRRSIDREQPLTRPGWADDDSAAALVAQLVDTERTPASEAIQQELARKLNAAIGELGDDDRDLLLMRHHEQLTNGEVAAALGLTEAAASMRYLRALRRLRLVLVPDGDAKPE